METGSHRSPETPQSPDVLPHLRKGTLYDILGVSPDATVQQIKAAKRELLKKYHPDRFERSAQSAKGEAEASTRVIIQATEVLLDPESRAVYDREGAKLTPQRGRAESSDAGRTRDAGERVHPQSKAGADDEKEVRNKTVFDAWFEPWFGSVYEAIKRSIQNENDHGRFVLEIERQLRTRTENPDFGLTANQQAEYLRTLRQEIIRAEQDARAEAWSRTMMGEGDRGEGWMRVWLETRDDKIMDDIAAGYKIEDIQAGLMSDMRHAYSVHAKGMYATQRWEYDDVAAWSLIQSFTRERWEAYCQSHPWWKRVLGGDFRR